MAECLMCDEKLNQDGDCPNGCTEEPDYGIMEDITDDMEIDDYDDEWYPDDDEYDPDSDE